MAILAHLTYERIMFCQKAAAWPGLLMLSNHKWPGCSCYNLRFLRGLQSGLDSEAEELPATAVPSPAESATSPVEEELATPVLTVLLVLSPLAAKEVGMLRGAEN